MERRQIATIERAYSILEVRAVDSEKRIISGMATTPTPDRLGDVVEPLGVKYKNPLPLLLYHDHKRPVGTVKFGKPSEEGIEFEASLPTVQEPGTLRDRVEEAWQSVKLRLVRGVSIGFRVLNDGIELMRNGGLRFTETEVLELSLVTVPANAECTIETIKSMDAPHLAAIGAGDAARRVITKSGDADTATRRAPKDASRMKTTQERITDLQTQIAAKTAEMNAIQEKCSTEGRAKTKEEREEFNELRDAVKDLEAEVEDLKALEEIQVRQAAQADGTTRETASVTRGGGTATGLVTRSGNRVVSVSEPKLPPGIGFARHVIAHVSSRLTGMSPLDIAKRAWPSHVTLHQFIERAAVPAGSTQAGNWAEPLANTTTDLAAEFLEFLRPATILGRFGTNGIPSLRRVPFNIRVKAQTQGGTGYWVGQGKAKPLTRFGYSAQSLAFTKVAAITVITEELARFSSPSAEGMVRDSLRDCLVERLDIDFIDPAHAGTANVSPASITNGVAAMTSAGITADNVRADIQRLIGAFIATNANPAGLVLIMPTTLALALSLMTNALGQAEFPNLSMAGGTVQGIPVITSQYAANASGYGNLVIAVNANDILLADDNEVTVDASREATLEMSDTPTQDSTVPTASTGVSMFQTNSIALRAERFVNWSKARAGAVAYIDDVNWGSAGSPQ